LSSILNGVIMQSKEFVDLVEDNKKLIQLHKKRGHHLDSILADLYNDPSHFVYEILQNADDADPGATEVTFKLYEDRLDIYHNGGDFDFQDIEGVTGIGITTKRDDITKIGKFGIGFKSVFAITQTPEIHSGQYHIRIEDLFVPTEIPANSGIKGTEIILPFNHKLRSKEEVFNLINTKLENIGLKTLLFVKNINEIKWESPSKSGHYYKKVDEIKKSCLAKRVSLILAKGGEDSVEEYIVIEKTIRIEEKDLKIEVAYRIRRDKEGKERIISEPDPKLVVFFPTDKDTYLNFLIQGPYKTTPNRENIPLGDKQNKVIIEETANLIAESLTVIKEIGFLDVNFLNILPISTKHEEAIIYQLVYQKIVEKLQSDEELLPTFEGNYARASDALLARGKELPEILKQEDVECLFSKRYWLDTDITYDRTRELRDYLVGVLGIQEIDFEAFARKITSDFLSSKSDEWMIEFYKRLLDQSGLWRESNYRASAGVLRFKPIIRLENNEHIEPFDRNGEIQVYLPTDTKSEYKTVKAVLLKDEGAGKFLKELGLEKPDLFSEISEFILPKFKEPSLDSEEYFDYFDKLLNAYKLISSDKKEKLIEELKNLPFVYAINAVTNETYLKKPSEVYSPEPDLKEYFSKCKSAYFVADELCGRFDKDVLFAFLKDMGIEDKPRRIEIPAYLSSAEEISLRGGTGCTRRISQKDYKYDGLDEFVSEITFERSILLWKLLLKSIEPLRSWEAEKFFRGEYKWKYFSEHTVSFEANFLKILKQTSWLVDKDGSFKKPCELIPSNLSLGYMQEGTNRDILIKDLGFQPDLIDQLQDEDKEFLRLKETGYTAEEIRTILEESKKKNESVSEPEDDNWKPEHLPDEVPINKDEVEFVKILSPDLEDQTIPIQSSIPDGVDNEDNRNSAPTRTRNSYKIGKWGEEYVFRALKEEYEKRGTPEETESGFKISIGGDGFIEVVWLNKNSNVGKGYDFVIKDNNTEIEYIEVKTKTIDEPELIEITGTQWEFARKLYDKNEGEKYWIYVVSNAGSTHTKYQPIKNPIKLWKEGRLYAHPIHFRI